MFPQTNYSDIIKNDYMISRTKLVGKDFIERRNCINKRTMAECSMRIIQKSLLTVEACEKLVNEIEILKELDHPNLMRIYECY